MACDDRLDLTHDGVALDAEGQADIDLEPALADAKNLTMSGTDTTFSIAVDSRAAGGGGTFSIVLDGNGDVTRLCTNLGKGGCRATADAAGNLW